MALASSSRKGKRAIKIAGGLLPGLFLIAAGIVIYVYTHPMVLVALEQKFFYTALGKEPNSYEPWFEPMEQVKPNGILWKSDIAYSAEYPNSYLDILYPAADTAQKRPTVIFLPGGGMFSGTKLTGDPMAASDSGSLYDELVLKGYNLVAIDYAKANEYVFPSQLIQINCAFQFLIQHGAEYGLDMDHVILYGSSAGAQLAMQSGLAIVQEEYARGIGITAAFSPKQVKALIVDDCPFRVENMDWATMAMVKFYFGTNGNLDETLVDLYDASRHVDNRCIPAFFVAANKGGFPDDMAYMHELYQGAGVDTEYYYRGQEYGELEHGFMTQLLSNEYSRECFEQAMAFVAAHCEGDK